MQTVSSVTTFPVIAGIKWVRTWHAVVATPVRVPELVGGVLAWAGVRVGSRRDDLRARRRRSVERSRRLSPSSRRSRRFSVGSPSAPCSPAITSSVDNPQWLAAIFRFGLVPLFLFSGTFFPVSQLPGWVEPLAWATPLWHGVELCRDLASGSVELGPTALHVGYLVVLTAAGRVRGRPLDREEASRMSTFDTALRILPRVALGGRSWHLVERNIASSRGAWIVFVSGFFEPLFYLLALGVGVGQLVGNGRSRRRHDQLSRVRGAGAARRLGDERCCL